MKPNSGRIRLYRDQAFFLHETLDAERYRLVIRRADAKEKGESTYDFNRRIESLDKISDELRRTIVEMGWLDG